MRQRDLRNESHFKAIALWFRLAGVALVGVATWLIVSTASLGLTGSRAFAPLLFGATAFLLLLGCGYYLVGEFLARLRNCARLTVVVLTLVSAGLELVRLIGGAMVGQLRLADAGALFSFAWTAAVVSLLLGDPARRLTTPEYRHLVAETRNQTAPLWRSPYFYLPAALVGLVLVGALLFFGVAGMSSRD